MRNLITKYHENTNKPIPFSIQVQIYNSLWKYKVSDIYLYNHIIFKKCNELVSDCWKNRKKVKNLKLAKETGISGCVGRPREFESKQMRKAVKVNSIPTAARHYLRTN